MRSAKPGNHLKGGFLQHARIVVALYAVNDSTLNLLSLGNGENPVLNTILDAT